MYASYHDINDNGVYSLEELYGFYRYSDVVEFYPADAGDWLVEPSEAYRYKMVGYITDVSQEDASCELVLVVCHERLELPSYERVAALV